MRRVPVKFLREGSIVARNIYDKDGRILLSEGSEINTKLIELLKKYDILSAYIVDKHSPNVHNDIISDDLRIKVVLELKRIANEFANNGSRNGNSDVRYDYFNNIKELVIQIVDELLSKEALIEGIDIRNTENYYFAHSVNVAILSIILGSELKYDRNKLVDLGLAALLHDIGFVFIPKEIVYKKTERTVDEEKIYMTHCEKGYEYLCKFQDLDEEIREPALYHHEKLASDGHAKNLNGKRVGEFSKIVSIADFYDELMSTGIMLQENLPNNVLEQIMAYVGCFFEFELVSLFYKKTIPFVKGTMLKLNNGDIALVEGTIEGIPLRPIVRILKSHDETKINKCINLADNLTVSIVEIVYYL